MSAIDVARFREVAGHFASGVVVVAAMSEQGPVGFTCQSFGSLSLDPALVMFAAGRDGTSWPRIKAVAIVGISVLAHDQESIARVFATSGVDKFEGVPWQTGVNGAPMITGSLASFEGSIIDVATYGDHDVAVVAIDGLHAREGAPLVYFRGGFGTFAV